MPVRETTRDEQQPAGRVERHADRVAAVRYIDEQLGGPALEVAAEDVAAEQVSGEEVAPRPPAMPSAELAPGSTMTRAGRDPAAGTASAIVRASIRRGARPPDQRRGPTDLPKAVDRNTPVQVFIEEPLAPLSLAVDKTRLPGAPSRRSRSSSPSSSDNSTRRAVETDATPRTAPAVSRAQPGPTRSAHHRPASPPDGTRPGSYAERRSRVSASAQLSESVSPSRSAASGNSAVPPATRAPYRPP